LKKRERTKIIIFTLRVFEFHIARSQ
jgi:hypothetical protein